MNSNPIWQKEIRAQKTEKEELERIVYLFVDVKVLRIVLGTKHPKFFRYGNLFDPSMFFNSNILSHDKGGKILSNIVLPKGYEKGLFYSNLPAQARLYSVLSANITRVQRQAIEHLKPLSSPLEIEETVMIFKNSIVSGSVEFANKKDRERILQMITEGKEGQSYEDLIRIVSLAKRCAVYNDLDFSADLATREDEEFKLYGKPGIKIRTGWL